MGGIDISLFQFWNLVFNTITIFARRVIRRYCEAHVQGDVEERLAVVLSAVSEGYCV